MKNLKDTILEKLKVDDITFNEFPIDGSIEDMIEFLKENGFRFIKNEEKISVLFDSANSKCYTTYKNRIWFADTSKEKISKDNPVFTHVDDNHKLYTVYFINNLDSVEHIVEDDKKEFLKELNKRFGW